MNMTAIRRAVDYLFKLCVRDNPKPEQIPYYPQKTRSAMSCHPQSMPRRVSPESQGISSSYIEDFYRDLERDPHSRMHNVLIFRNGKLISGASAPGYSPRIWSLTHSMAKTVTSFALACVMGDGLLTPDTRLVDIFAKELPIAVSPRMKRVTVRHLLTMTAGVTGVSESLSVTGTAWKHDFLATFPSAEPGKRFFYNSLNSYILGAIVETITGQSLEEYLQSRLFSPLGITDYYIEKSPEGIAKSGWGMYITPADMGKLGQLILQDGVWQGKQILPADYLAEATRAQVETSGQYGDYNYGYHLWVARDRSAILFNGMLGQNIWINPRTGMVIVSTAGNDEFFQMSTTLRLVAKYFGGDFTPPATLMPNLIAAAHLHRTEENFFRARFRLPETGQHEDLYSRHREVPIPPQIKEILGVYSVEKNNVGLLPLTWRAMQNNHSEGITRIAFSAGGKDFRVHVTEGTTERILECGVGTFRYTELDYRGEKYLVGTMCVFTENEDGEPLFKIDIVFPELPNTRRIKVYFYDGGRTVFHLSELPGTDMLYTVLGSLAANATLPATLVEFARNRMSDPLLQSKILHCMEPVLYARREDAVGTETDGKTTEKAAVIRRLTGEALRKTGKKK